MRPITRLTWREALVIELRATILAVEDHRPIMGVQVVRLIGLVDEYERERREGGNDK